MAICQDGGQAVTASSAAWDFHWCFLKKYPVFRNTHIAVLSVPLKTFNWGMRRLIKKHPLTEDVTCLLCPSAASGLVLGVMIKASVWPELSSRKSLHWPHASLSVHRWFTHTSVQWKPSAAVKTFAWDLGELVSCYFQTSF